MSLGKVPPGGIVSPGGSVGKVMPGGRVTTPDGKGTPGGRLKFGVVLSPEALPSPASVVPVGPLELDLEALEHPATKPRTAGEARTRDRIGFMLVPSIDPGVSLLHRYGFDNCRSEA